MPQETPIAVAVVNYNTCAHLRACLTTVQQESPSAVVVVDNASSDGSVEMVRTHFPGVMLSANETNLGYGTAANQAIANCAAKYVLLLNSDTLVQPGALHALSAYLDLHPQAAMVGPRLVNPDGTLQASCYPFPTPFNILLVNTSLGRLVGHVPLLRGRSLHAWSHTATRAVPWVLGAALAIRREAFDGVGGFDPSFFMYYEEVDLCYRLRTAGWQVHFAPVTTIVHTGGASTMQLRTDMAIRFFRSLKQFYQQHYSRGRLAQMVVVVKSIVLFRWLLDSARLYLARDTCQRVRLAADVAAWQCIFLGHEQNQTIGGVPPEAARSEGVGTQR